MAQIKLGDSVLVVGVATKDAELKMVGDKKTPLVSFGLAVGKNQHQQTIFANCKAWRKLAEYAAQIRKGDAVCAIGTIEEREWNGKTYKDLMCDWVNVAAPHGDAYEPAPSAFANATELGDDSELPF